MCKAREPSASDFAVDWLVANVIVVILDRYLRICHKYMCHLLSVGDKACRPISSQSGGDKTTNRPCLLFTVQRLLPIIVPTLYLMRKMSGGTRNGTDAAALSTGEDGFIKYKKSSSGWSFFVTEVEYHSEGIGTIRRGGTPISALKDCIWQCTLVFLPWTACARTLHC
jgi:hypothetical protein